MASYHPACLDCVLSGGECLLQGNDDVESCEDVREYDLDAMDDKQDE